MKQYPYLNNLAEELRIDKTALIQGFELEKKFREKIFLEKDPIIRKKLYADLYSTIIPLYTKTHIHKTDPVTKLYVVEMFEKELAGKSILDVGCGAGEFLQCISERLNHKALMGIDLVIPTGAQKCRNIQFEKADIINFSLDKEFDIVVSDNVMEHIAPADLPQHLKSINRALKKNGKFILILPNRLFGPSDATRIIDNTHTNRISACGSHLFESTYSELIPLLSDYGFGDFKTTIQLPILHRTFLRFLRQIRINPSIYIFIENSHRLINLLYKTRRKDNSYVFMLLLILICKKQS